MFSGVFVAFGVFGLMVLVQIVFAEIVLLLSFLCLLCLEVGLGICRFFVSLSHSWVLYTSSSPCGSPISLYLLPFVLVVVFWQKRG